VERTAHRVAIYTVEGGAKEYGKTSRSRRSVPLSDRSLAALDDLTARIDSPLLWPVYSHGGARGRPVHLNLANWRKRIWKPALEAAGLQREGELWLPGPYSMRHAFATWMLDAGIEVFELARLMRHLGRDDRQDLRPPGKEPRRAGARAHERSTDDRDRARERGGRC
jgi:integrase